MLVHALLGAVVCAQLLDLGAELQRAPPKIEFDPNLELIRGNLNLSNYDTFRPSEEYKARYNQTLFELSPGQHRRFETTIGKPCRRSFMLRTDSLYDRTYADAHPDQVELYILSGRMDFYKHDCAGQPFFQTRDARIYDRRECRLDHTIALAPCQYFRHDASGPHSVSIKELSMLRLMCFL